MNIWTFLVSILICFLSLKELNKEQYDVNYKYEKAEDSYQFLFCFPIKEIDYYSNRTEIELNQLREDVIKHFNTSKFRQKIQSYISSDTILPDEFLESESEHFNQIFKSFKNFNVNRVFLDDLKSKNYLIFKNRICLIKNDDCYDWRPFTYFFKNPNYYLFKNETYEFSKLVSPFEINDIAKKSSKLLKMIRISHLDYPFSDSSKIAKLSELSETKGLFSDDCPFKSNQLIVLNKEKPFSNCLNTKNNQIYLKSICLNNCFKSKFKLTKYYYNSNETGTVYLGTGNNLSIAKNERKCFEKCKEDNCKLTYFVNNINKPEEIRNKTKTSFFRAYPLVPGVNYFIQFLGIILGCFNTSMYEICSKFNKQLINNGFKIEKSKLNTIALLICLIPTLTLFSIFLSRFTNKLVHPVKNEVTGITLTLEPLKIVVCVPVNYILLQDYSLEYYEDPDLFRNLTFSELENKTTIGFNQTVKDIYLTFQNKPIKVNWFLNNTKVLFFQRAFSRCFLVHVFPKEPKYQSLLAISKLTIEFKHDNYFLYLLTENESFHSKSYYYNPDLSFSLVKKEQIRSKYNGNQKCLNYEEIDSQCTNRQNCFEQCVNRYLIENYSKVSSFYVIDKNWFNTNQWTEITADTLDYHNIEDKQIFIEAETSCKNESKFQFDQYLDCHEIKFENHLRTNLQTYLKKQFDLYYNVITSEEKIPSISKLILDLLNIKKLFFPSIAIQTLIKKLVILNLPILTLVSVRFVRFKSELVYLFCLIGFLIHISFIYYSIKTEQLDVNQFYEVPNSIEMPQIVFCFKFDQSSIDETFEFTGNNLDKLTDNIRVNTIFDKIIYLNNQNEWISLDEKSNFTNSEFKIDTFYFLKRKCFKIKQNIDYNRTNFHFLDNNKVQKIFFNTSLFKNEMNTTDVLFFTMQQNEMHLSKVNSLNFLNTRFSVGQKLIYIEKADRFNWIKRPWTLFDGKSEIHDIAEYINQSIDSFKAKKNLTTLELPLERREIFDLKIDDYEFEKYYNESLSNLNYLMSENSNYRRQYASNRILFSYDKDIGIENAIFDKNDEKKTNFDFSLIFFKKVIKITNEENEAKLILNLLNALTVWFGFEIIDKFIYKIKEPIKHSVKRMNRTNNVKLEIILTNDVQTSLIELDKKSNEAQI